MSTPEHSDSEVEWYKSMLADLVPYSDPNYEQKLDSMARGCLKAEQDPDFMAMCTEHDRRSTR